MCSRNQFLLHLFCTRDEGMKVVINCGKSDILKGKQVVSLEKRFSNKFFQCLRSSQPASTCSLQLPFVLIILTKLLKGGNLHSPHCRIIQRLPSSGPERKFNSCYQYLIIQFCFYSFCRFAEQVSVELKKQLVTQLQTSIQKASKNCKTVELQRLVVNRFHSNKRKERLLMNMSVVFTGNITE